MQLDIYQVDAFADRPLAGNPAAVCPLPDAMDWPETEVMQAIARENNLSETAFFKAEGEGYRLRWFTPGVEVPLCGHATLASAWVLFNRLKHKADTIQFETLSGRLTVSRDGAGMVMDFPANPAAPLAKPPSDLAAALGGKVEAAFRTTVGNGFLMAVYACREHVETLTPDFASLAKLDQGAIIATAPGGSTGYDFVSRMFAPAKGVNEDPVTGSAHCVLTPYWAGRLGKRVLKARQVSARGGDIGCRLDGDRVHLSGVAALYLEGRITI